MLILSGDIGATKARMAFIETTVAGLQKCQECKDVTLLSAKFNDAQALITQVITMAGKRPDVISLGVAGPVRDQYCEATNIPWRIDGNALQHALSIPVIHIINDLEAIARGIPTLGEADICELNPGKPDPKGNLTVIAAGTGLGEAGVCRQTGGFHPFSSEGGHTDFAPANQAKELALLEFLANRYGHVSWERVVSGLGIPNILEFLCQYRNSAPPTSVQECLTQGAGAACISAAANTGDCPLCEEAMEMFVCMYGREAGNHALKIMATGGVYLAGGIAPKILQRLQSPTFLASFFDKGRMQPIMRNMPVRVILNGQVALFGAAMAVTQHLNNP